jgi:lipopolysaccharide cholinephosphotransferase
MSLKHVAKRVLSVSADTRSSVSRDIRYIREQMLTVADAHQIHDELHWDVSVQLLNEVRALRNELVSHDEKSMMFAWEGYRTDGEDLAEAKKRFFRSLPEASGGLRLLQLGCTKLLAEFDRLCEENSLQYIMAFGTLLGAVRHQGFIPWDDDVDLAMPRDDLDKLISIVANDDRYEVSVAYDAYVNCRQVRFKYADKNVPCFLDLFYFDWAPDEYDSSASGMRALRDKMIEKMQRDEALAFWRDEEPCILANDPRAARIGAYFDETLQRAKELGIVCDRGSAKAIVWSHDNMTSVQKRQTYAISDTLPAVELSFEKAGLKAPANYDLFLRSAYGDYLELPNDLRGHYEHVSRDGLDSGASYDALSDLLR